MLRGFFGNLICAIIARMLCGNHLNIARIISISGVTNKVIMIIISIMVLLFNIAFIHGVNFLVLISGQYDCKYTNFHSRNLSLKSFEKQIKNHNVSETLRITEVYLLFVLVGI